MQSTETLVKQLQITGASTSLVVKRLSSSGIDLHYKWWPEAIASFTASISLLSAVFTSFNIRTRQNAGSDFKTLYASSWCFARGSNAYSFSSLATVFDRNHVVVPHNWYAHAPVYPPITLALLAPITALPMVAAVYLWIVLSAFAVAGAVTVLAREGGKAFRLTRPWRMLLIGLAALFPLVSFALELGNVSLVVASLCILGVAAPKSGNPWFAAFTIVIGVLLKPHLAVWVVIALMLSQAPQSRVVAFKALIICAGICLMFGLWAASPQKSFVQFGNYRTIVASEVSTGSMMPQNREQMDVAAQITSLQSLLGFWFSNALSVRVVEIVFLSFTGTVLALSSLRLQATNQEAHFHLIASWCAFGMMATYHRAHDGVMFLLLLPSVVSRLQNSWRDSVAWCVFALLVAMSVGFSPGTIQLVSAVPSIYVVAQVLLYRQASLAVFLLAMLLLVLTVCRTHKEHIPMLAEKQNAATTRC